MRAGVVVVLSPERRSDRLDLKSDSLVGDDGGVAGPWRDPGPD
jgi:hypothetical protein